MDNIREKLVELIHDARMNALWHNAQNPDEYIADMLIANGVTVQKRGGCAYCQEDRDGYRRMSGAFFITNPFHGNEWFINTGHCKPRQIYFCHRCGRELTTPPKGE